MELALERDQMIFRAQVLDDAPLESGLRGIREQTEQPLDTELGDLRPLLLLRRPDPCHA